MGTSLYSTEQCVRKCLECYQICTEYAMNHCLKHGDKYVEPTHFRLMLNCAEVCDIAAKFMLSDSVFHGKLCAVCADVCEACAQSCEEIGQMDECVRTCRECAESCLQMAGATAGRARAGNVERRSAAPM
jgi:hypothetical protein